MLEASQKDPEPVFGGTKQFSKRSPSGENIQPPTISARSSAPSSPTVPHCVFSSECRSPVQWYCSDCKTTQRDFCSEHFDCVHTGFFASHERSPHPYVQNQQTKIELTQRIKETEITEIEFNHLFDNNSNSQLLQSIQLTKNQLLQIIEERFKTILIETNQNLSKNIHFHNKKIKEQFGLDLTEIIENEQKLKEFQKELEEIEKSKKKILNFYLEFKLEKIQNEINFLTPINFLQIEPQHVTPSIQIRTRVPIPIKNSNSSQLSLAPIQESSPSLPSSLLTSSIFEENVEVKQQHLTIFHAYQIQNEQVFLGEGSAGQVQKGKVLIDNQWTEVALKHVVVGSNNNIRLKVLEEINSLAKFGSKYVCKIYGYYEWLDKTKANQKVVTAVLEYCGKNSLYQLLQTEKLNLIQKLRMARHIAFGIKCLHDNGFIHRDVKSLNVLVNSNFGCKLADFGLAKSVSSDGLHSYVGSQKWLAPEVTAENTHYTQAADIYSLGWVYYELFEEVSPLDFPDRKDLEKKNFKLKKFILPLLEENQIYRVDINDVIQGQTQTNARRPEEYEGNKEGERKKKKKGNQWKKEKACYELKHEAKTGG